MFVVNTKILLLGKACTTLNSVPALTLECMHEKTTLMHNMGHFDPY